MKKCVSKQHAVLVALSGGVDSTTAAYLLKKKWNTIVGATHYIWHDSRCCSSETILRARKICTDLGIPYYLVDLSQLFRSSIVENFVSTYLGGRTPNPCVLCNEIVRFGAFYQKMQTLLRTEQVIDDSKKLFFATGHYARLERTVDGYFLRKAKDLTKDQSYMLYRIPQQMLGNCFFPLGDYVKSEILELSRRQTGTNTLLRESQDACFIRDDYGSFVAGYASSRSASGPTAADALSSDAPQMGAILDMYGNVLGKHPGCIYYTVGQRRGLHLSDGPWYVASIDPTHNNIYVARRKDAEKKRYHIEKSNWFIETPFDRILCSVKLRYQSQEMPCSAIWVDKDRVAVEMTEPQIAAPGQSAVFYRDDLILGGGIICA